MTTELMKPFNFGQPGAPASPMDDAIRIVLQIRESDMSDDAAALLISEKIISVFSSAHARGFEAGVKWERGQKLSASQNQV